MPELKDMKLSDASDEESRGLGDEYARRHPYGFGLSLYLDDEQLEKLGIREALEAGTMVDIEAKGIVESATESVDVQEGHEVRMTIQITHLGLEQQGVAENAAAILYPNMNKGD